MVKTRNKRLYLILVLLSAISICAFTGISYSKFVHEEHLIETSKVAQPIFVASALTQNIESYSLELENCNPTMSTQTYSFTISNYSGELVTETAYAYVVTISTSAVLPLDIVVKKGDDTITTITSLNTSFTSSAYALGTSSAVSDTFTLEISWDPDDKDSIYSGLVDTLDISINWSQID